MTRTAAFTAAHALTRRTIQSGDSYSATFGLCLRAVLAGYRAETAQQVADRIAALIEGAGMQTSQDDDTDDDYNDVIRVYVTQRLSRHRGWRADRMGHVEINCETGAVSPRLLKRRAFIRDLIAA